MCSASLLLFFSSLLAVSEAHTRARLISQERAAYEGGWALAIPGSDCPSDAPVACTTNDATVNPTCCPSGQTCFGLLNPHCCPTDSDCQNVVENLPICANSTWNMYELDLSSRYFFCCEPGQFGVLPISGYAGICEPNDQSVASSLIATAATQAGAAGAAATGNTGGAAGAKTSAVTSTLQGGAVTTILTTIAGTATSTQTNGASSTGGSSSSNPISTEAKKLGLSTGAIIGIAVGALLIILLCASVYFLCRRKRNNRYRREGVAQGAIRYDAVPQPYQPNPPEYKSPVTGYAVPQQGYAVSPLTPGREGYGGSPPPQGYGPSQPPPVQRVASPAVEVPAPQRWMGRPELG